MDDFAEAKEIYFRCVGSRFYMSRSGEDQVFDSYQVPANLVEEWKVELKEAMLAKLREPGNHMVITYLEHHGDLEHLKELIAAPPLGELREKCAYLEGLLRYADRCVFRAHPAQLLWAALDHVIVEARKLRGAVSSEDSIARVAGVLQEAQQRLDACVNESGERTTLWRWGETDAEGDALSQVSAAGGFGFGEPGVVGDR